MDKYLFPSFYELYHDITYLLAVTCSSLQRLFYNKLFIIKEVHFSCFLVILAGKRSFNRSDVDWQPSIFSCERRVWRPNLQQAVASLADHPAGADPQTVADYEAAADYQAAADFQVVANPQIDGPDIDPVFINERKETDVTVQSETLEIWW